MSAAEDPNQSNHLSDDEASLWEDSLYDDDSSFAGDDEDGSKVSGGSASQLLAAGAELETKTIQCWRVLLALVLIFAASGICAATYFFVREETNDYEVSYKIFAGAIESTLAAQFDNLEGSVQDLGETITSSSAEEDGSRPFPFVTVEQFEHHGEQTRARSKIEAITFAPLVSASNKTDWEDFSVRNQDWIEASRDVVMAHEDRNPVYLPGFISPFIYRFKDGIFAEPVDSSKDYFAPIWHMSPPPTNPAIVNFDVLSHDDEKYQTFLQHVITERESSFSPVVDVEKFLSLQVSDLDHLRFHQQFATISSGTGYDLPHALYAQPVFESSRKEKVTGILLGEVAWDAYLAGLLPNGINGVVVVLRCTCAPEANTFTYELNGAQPLFLGQGDLHDPSYDRLVRKIPLLASTGTDIADQTRAQQESGGSCNYSMDLYASDKFKDQYDSRLAIIATTTVGVTFVIVALIFIVYDVLVHVRNRKVTESAKRSNAVVSSLFPSVVLGRLMEDTAPGSEEKRRSSDLTPFKGGGVDEVAEEKYKPGSSKPIADLFPQVTIMFGDLVGFTAWSSTREPSQVFQLLEALYAAFDEIARKRGVFKVETIGDCYVAACGVPKPCRDHYAVMARFSRDCLRAFLRLVKELEVALGPDTADLGLRIGLHSGPVTAGVLRGDRARFQLFGDSMNTAARIESSGAKNRIHCSEETAKLLMAAGKSDWVIPREDKVFAKGLGELQTFWVDDKVNRNSGVGGSTSGESISSSNHGVTGMLGSSTHGDCYGYESETRLSSKTLRLIEWNVEILVNLLKKIVHRRRVCQRIDSKKGRALVQKQMHSPVKGKPLDEVAEIISLPEFDASVQNLSESDVQLSDTVVDQLRNFVSGIASMYNDNPFHCFEHASHVTMSVSKLMARIVAPSDEILDSQRPKEGSKDLAATLHDHTYGITSDPLTQFACLISALIHDVDHQGVPNGQLVKEKAAVALKYDDTSPAEQNSIDLAWELLMEDRFDDLRSTICATPDEFARFRQLVVNAVMATDIMDKKLKALRNARWETAFNEDHKDENPRDTENRKATIVIEHLIQASDVAHTMQHWHIYRKWNERFFRECYNAYLHGRSESDPSEHWYKGEIGFFDFYIIPLAKKLKDCGVFGVSSDEYLQYAEKNRTEWESRGEAIVAEMVEKAQKEWANKE